MVTFFIIISIVTILYLLRVDFTDRKEAEQYIKDTLDCYSRADIFCLSQKTSDKPFVVFFPVKDYKIKNLRFSKGGADYDYVGNNAFLSKISRIIYPNMDVNADVTIEFKEPEYVPEFYRKGHFYVWLHKVRRHWRLYSQTFDLSVEFDTPSALGEFQGKFPSKEEYGRFFAKYEGISDTELRKIIMHDHKELSLYTYLWSEAQKKGLIIPSEERKKEKIFFMQ